MVYKILKFEVKQTSTGKTLAKCDLMGDGNEVTTGVTIWGDFLGFSSLAIGGQVEGDIVTKDNFKTLYAPRGPKRAAGGVNITKAMETKKENIKEAQDRRDFSIKLAGIQRDAVLLVTTFYPEYNDVGMDSIQKEEAIKARLLEWKKWLEQVYGDGQPF